MTPTVFVQSRSTISTFPSARASAASPAGRSRIGHLGDINDLTLLGALAGVEMSLGLAGVDCKASGVLAAMGYLRETSGAGGRRDGFSHASTRKQRANAERAARLWNIWLRNSGYARSRQMEQRIMPDMQKVSVALTGSKSPPSKCCRRSGRVPDDRRDRAGSFARLAIQARASPERRRATAPLVGPGQGQRSGGTARLRRTAKGSATPAGRDPKSASRWSLG